MELNVVEERKLVEIWLTKKEQQDATLKEKLQMMYRRCHEQGYRPVVFCSGRENLYKNTKDLLLYNRKRSAELKNQAATAM